MFPAKCRKPPCTNIEVSTVTQENAAGINPNRMMNSLTWSPIENSRKNTSALMTMIETVTKGVVREGMTSRSGIIGGVRYQESGPVRIQIILIPGPASIPDSCYLTPDDDMQTLRCHHRRQGADLLPLRKCDHGTADQAAGGRLPVRTSAPVPASARRDRRADRAGAGRGLGDGTSRSAAQPCSLTPAEMSCSVSPVRRSLPSFTARSPSDRIPTNWLFSTTGSRRTWCSLISSFASRVDMSGDTQTTPVVTMSRTGRLV